MNPPAAQKPLLVALRPVAPPDESFLLRLYATTRAGELARTGWTAAQRDEFIRTQYHARRADYSVRYFGAEHSIITIHGRDAGVWMIWRIPTEILLVNIELLPESQGQGVGSTLLRRLLIEAKASQLPAKLSVRDDNRAAARLYLRLGFSLEGHENGYLRMRYKS